MGTPDIKKKEYDYDDLMISLENCILPQEKIDETPSMNDGLDRDTENDLRMFGCEIIQTAGLLLRLPQVAMATGQVLLQRFYFSKSMVKHDVEVSAMAAIFLAAKIEENPRRLRDVINVCHHIKQRLLQKRDTIATSKQVLYIRSHTPMDYFSTQYFNTKNAVIKAERRILKELGFCVHVKHPHKLIITYLQMIDHHTNVALAKKAWNYMNDSLRSDVFVRFSPETIACACIFLAARTTKVNLPQRPPWFELFDATYNEVEEISLAILRLYARPRRKITHLEAIVHKIKKTKADKEKAAAAIKDDQKSGSFTPSHATDDATNATQPPNPAVEALNNNNSKSNSQPPSRTSSPLETSEKIEKKTLSSVISKSENNNSNTKKGSNRRYPSDSEESSEYSSDSGNEVSSKKRKRDDRSNAKKRHSSSDSENDRRLSSKIRRSVSPRDERKSKSYKDGSNRDKLKSKETNGYSKNSRTKKRSRSRSPVRRRSSSPASRKDKYYREKDREREKNRSRDKYSSKSRR